MPPHLFLGAAFVVVGVWLIIRSSVSLQQTTVVDGEVVYLEQVEMPAEVGTTKATWPVIEFKDWKGEPRRILDPTNPFRHPGDSVRVLYSTVSGEAKVYSPLRLWLPGSTMVCLGIAAIAFGPF
jgi:hypothetical protein